MNSLAPTVANCHVSGTKGKRVLRVTLNSLLKTDRVGRIGGSQWLFYDGHNCDVVCFSAYQ